MAGFIFGGDTGIASAEELARKRKIVDALLETGTVMPRTFGEGLSVFGRAIAGRLKDNKLRKQEDAERSRARSAFDSLAGQGGFGGEKSNIAVSSGDPLDPVNISGDTMAALGKDSGTAGYRASLIGTESGGNWRAQNNEIGSGGKAGHFGRVQFGHARLQEAMDAGAIPQGTTPEQFVNSPALQIAAENWHFADLEKNLGDLVGKTVNGKPMDIGALVAMGHLGGAGGARKYVESGGAYNPQDSFGTSLSEYAATHGGQGGQGGQITMSAAGGGDAGRISQLSDLAANPYLPEGQRSVIAALLNSEMQNMLPQDPMRAIELERAQLELEQLRNPTAKTPEALTERRALAGAAGLVEGTPEYQAYIATGKLPEAPEPGFRPMTPDEVAQLGLPPGPYQISPKGEIKQIGGNGTTVKIDMGTGSPDLGKLSTDYGYLTNPDGSIKRDSETGLAIAAPVPGSPAAVDAANAEKKSEMRNRQAAATANIVLEDIDKAIEQTSGWSAGAGGALTGMVPGTPARDLEGSLNTIKANIGFDRLQQMRESSPTGGALGAIAVPELIMLQAVLGSITTDQSPKQLKANLQRLKEVYEPIAKKAAAYPSAEEFGFGGGGGSASTSADLGLSDDDLRYLEQP